VQSAGPRGSGEEHPGQGWALPPEPESPPSWTTAPPDFVGIGAQRCGTTWWYEGAILAHPLVAVPHGRRKELHFFNRYWRDEVESDFATRYARFFPRPEGSITGEWTPTYMSDYWTVPLLREAAPEARYLIMLRDPVERYRSAIAPALTRSRARTDDMLSAIIASNAMLHSMYHGQVKRAFEILGRDRVLVLQYERCVEDPLGQMQRTQRFLRLEPLKAMPEALGRHVPSGRGFEGEKPELSARLRSGLAAALAHDVRQIAALCPEIDSGRWPHFASV
jgi:Sulfotransferase family